MTLQWWSPDSDSDGPTVQMVVRRPHRAQVRETGQGLEITIPPPRESAGIFFHTAGLGIAGWILYQLRGVIAAIPPFAPSVPAMRSCCAFSERSRGSVYTMCMRSCSRSSGWNGWSCLAAR